MEENPNMLLKVKHLNFVDDFPKYFQENDCFLHQESLEMYKKKIKIVKKFPHFGDFHHSLIFSPVSRVTCSPPQSPTSRNTQSTSTPESYHSSQSPAYDDPELLLLPFLIHPLLLLLLTPCVLSLVPPFLLHVPLLLRLLRLLQFLTLLLLFLSP